MSQAFQKFQNFKNFKTQKTQNQNKFFAFSRIVKRPNAKDIGFFRLILGESLAFTLYPYN
ncbi:hypothetical protein HPHPP41_0662 [Helicobacter pylori Hp P-41]|nr:hypothetical protein HPHPP41_0662 [Helicobacter pylori Hp P-41]